MIGRMLAGLAMFGLMAACTPANAAPAIASIAPDFSLASVEGQPLSLADFRGRPVLINFWATWCTPCRIEMPELVAAAERHSATGLVVLAIDVQEDVATVKPFVEEFKMRFPVAIDYTGDLVNKYRLKGLPTSIFVGRDGRIKYIHQGQLTTEILDTQIKAIV